MKKLLLIGLALGWPGLALAQSPVKTQPYGVTSTVTGGTITATNTFQQIWAASDSTRGRAGCLVSNNGASVMYVFLGAPASATTAKSIQVASGATWSCNYGGIVLQDTISLTGTASQFWSGAQQ